VLAPAPTVVFVHGGGTSSRFWDRVLPLVDAPALAVDLPGRGEKPADPMALTVADCVDSVVADVDAVTTGDVVLVAHSSGGLFVPGVVARLVGRVRHVVLSAASVAPEGGCGLDCMKASHRQRTVEGIEAARRDGWVLTTPGPPDDPEQLRTAYGDHLDDETLAFVCDPLRAVRDSMNFYFQPVSWAAAGDVPVTYVKHLRDRPVPVELQDAMISRLRTVRVIEVDTGHIPAVTHPELFAAIVNDVVASIAQEVAR
jgi:pimeloyl-ACP methyl ester carboxylesterase